MPIKICLLLDASILHDFKLRMNILELEESWLPLGGPESLVGWVILVHQRPLAAGAYIHAICLSIFPVTQNVTRHAHIAGLKYSHMYVSSLKELWPKTITVPL